jgi:anti-sigma factor RsiW
MSCSPFDLRDYFLQELAVPQRRLVESHVKTCPACRAELDQLQITESALLTLREEEIPQRIAFVSDPVFEPSPLRRFFSDFWGSAARLGFASAAMLSTALLVFALHRPAPAPPMIALAPAPAGITRVATDSDVRPIIDAAVSKAMADSEARHVQQTRQLVAEIEQARQRLQLAAEEYDFSQKRAGSQRVMAGLLQPPPDQGVVQ